MIILENEKDFEKLIKEGNVIVDFYATWCGPCKMLGPVLDEVCVKNTDIKIVKVDVDLFEELTRSHGVMSVPTLEIYKDGQLVRKEIGYHDIDTILSWF